jgi:small subunit ribosomal protein S6
LQHYEAAMLLSPNLSDKDVEKFVQETRELLAKYGATEMGEEKVERRAFAYEVKKHNEGFYVFVDFNAPPDLPAQVKVELRHREELLRLAFIRKPVLAQEPVPAPVPEPEPEPDLAPEQPGDETAPITQPGAENG